MTGDELKQIKDLIDERSAKTERHFDEKAAETQRHFDEKAVETQRHFDVVAEALIEKICLVAEGHDMLNEKLDRMTIEDDGRHQEVTGRLDRLEVGVGRVEEEMHSGFDELRSAIRFSYAELDRRVSTLESELVSFATRLERVEALVAN